VKHKLAAGSKGSTRSNRRRQGDLSNVVASSTTPMASIRSLPSESVVPPCPVRQHLGFVES
jgi:hypothetical protein